MKRFAALVVPVLLCLLAFAPAPALAAGVTATFTDAALFTAVSEQLTEKTVLHVDDASARTITLDSAAAESVTELNLVNRNVKNTTGLAVFSKLRHLNLAHNLVSDISGLATLDGLVYLDLYDNAVRDFGPLRDHTALTHLNLGENNDVSRTALENTGALSTLSNLTFLDLSENYTPGLPSDLSALTKLEHLNLQQNSIEDISGLSNMTEMKTLVLSHNNITGISALLPGEGRRGMQKLKELSLLSNRLYESSGTGIDGLVNDDGELALAALEKLDIWGNTNWNGFLSSTSKANVDKLLKLALEGRLELGFRYDRIRDYDNAVASVGNARLTKLADLPHVDSDGVRYVSYDDFGAYCDGVHDDYNAMRNAHLFANVNGCEVRATAGRTYHVFRLWDLNYYTVYANVDWQGARFVIHDEDIEDKGARYAPLLCLRPSGAGVAEAASAYQDIAPIVNPSWTVGKQTTSLATELAGTLEKLNAKRDANGNYRYGSYYVQVYDESTKHYKRYGSNANSGSDKWDGVRIGRDGAILEDGNATRDGEQVGGGFQWDFDQVTKAVVTPIPAERSHVRNATFTHTVPSGRMETPYSRGGGKPIYYLRNLQLRECANVELEGIRQDVGILEGNGTVTHGDGEQLSGSYTGFLEIRDTADVYVHGCSVWARKYESGGRSTYGLVMNRSVNVTLREFDNSNTWEQMLDDKRWGVMGTNHCKDVVFDSCTVNRIDAHEGFYNLYAKDCKLGSWGFRLIGQGPLCIENCDVYALSFIMLRYDYGSTWDGQARILNCRHHPTGTDSCSLISLQPSYDSSTELHDFGYELHYPDLYVKDLVVDESRWSAGKSEYYIVPNFTYDNRNTRLPESYWPNKVEIDGIDFVNYKGTLGYEPFFRLVATEEGTVKSKLGAYSASRITFEGSSYHAAIEDGEQLLTDGAYDITSAGNDSRSYRLTTDQMTGHEIAVEFEGTVPRIALMDASWHGWTTPNAYDVAGAGEASGEGSGGTRIAYFSDLAVNTMWGAKEGTSATSGGSSYTIGPLYRFRVITDGQTKVKRVALLNRDPSADPSYDEYADAPRFPLYTRTVALPRQAGSGDSTTTTRYSNYWRITQERLGGRELRVRFKGARPLLDVNQTSGSSWLCNASVAPDKVMTLEDGWFLARFSAAGIASAWEKAAPNSGVPAERKGGYNLMRLCVESGSSLEFDRVELVGGQEQEPDHGNVAGKSADAVLEEMGLGWNLGNALESYDRNSASTAYSAEDLPRADVACENSWGNPATTREMIGWVKAQGFKAVRVPVGWFQHTYDDGVDADKADRDPVHRYHIDEAWMARVHEVVDYCYSQGLYVIVDTHHDRLWLETPRFGEAGEHRDELKARLGAVWKQVATEFAAYDQRLVFEGLNEPRASAEPGTGEQVAYEREWGSAQTQGDIDTLNALYETFVSTVRSVPSPYKDTRLLLCPAYAGATDQRMLSRLRIPVDPYVGVSAHPYVPWNFTEADGQYANRHFDTAVDVELEQILYRMRATFASKGVPVALTEFSARDFGNTEERVKWATRYVSLARSYGMPCFLWDGGSLEETARTYEGQGYTCVAAYFDRTRLSWANERQEAVAKAMLSAAGSAWKDPAGPDVPEQPAVGTKLNGESYELTAKDTRSELYQVSWEDLKQGGMAVDFEGEAPVSLVMRDANGSNFTSLAASYVHWDAGAASGTAYFWPEHIQRIWCAGTSGGAQRELDALRQVQVNANGATTVQRVLAVTAHTHVWGEWTRTTEPTCEESGLETRICMLDAEHVQTRAVDALGHDWGAWEREDAENHKRICAHDAAHVEREAHSWDGGTVVREATAQEAGERVFTCTVCGAVRSEEIPRLQESQQPSGTGGSGGSGPASPAGPGGEAQPDGPGGAGQPDGPGGAEQPDGPKAPTDPEGPGGVGDPADSGDPDAPAPQLGDDGTAFGTGASAHGLDAAVTALKSDADPVGTRFAPLKLRSASQGKTSVKLAWTKTKRAVEYVVYAGKCGKKNKMARLVVTKKAKTTVKRAAGKKLKKGLCYKFMVAAVDSAGKVVSCSRLVHVATKGAKAANPTKVVRAKGTPKRVVLKKGKSRTLKFMVKKPKRGTVPKHRALSFESTNAKVASVSAKGKVKAKGAGSCYVHAYAQNGVYARVKVTVR